VDARWHTWILAALALAVLFVPRATATAADAVTAPYLSEFEREVLREQNLARTDPGRYANYVADWLQYYHGKVRQLPGGLRINTIEGKRGVVRAVRFLQAQEPLPPLSPSAGLSRAARDHVVDTGAKGWMGHFGSDGSEPADRISRYGKWYGRVGENITYGGTAARELVIRLIIDDGIPDRGHRENIFNPQFTLSGVAFGLHDEYGTMCVISYAAEFEEF
jgi:hypothetical protein